MSPPDGGDMVFAADPLLLLLGGTEDGRSKQRLDKQESVLSRTDGWAGGGLAAPAAATLRHCGDKEGGGGIRRQHVSQFVTR